MKGAFTDPSGLAPELWHFAYQWPLLEQPLQVAFCAEQLSQPGEWEWIQLGHCEVHFFLWFALLRLMTLAEGMDGLAGTHCSHS